MATYEPTGLFGCSALIKFDRQETERLAEGADIVALIGTLIPDPVLAPTIATSAKGCSIWAKSAIRRGKCLGIYLGRIAMIPIPFEYRP